jgi:hypothetical protein
MPLLILYTNTVRRSAAYYRLLSATRDEVVLYHSRFFTDAVETLPIQSLTSALVRMAPIAHSCPFPIWKNECGVLSSLAIDRAVPMLELSSSNPHPPQNYSSGSIFPVGSRFFARFQASRSSARCFPAHSYTNPRARLGSSPAITSSVSIEIKASSARTLHGNAADYDRRSTS